MKTTFVLFIQLIYFSVLYSQNSASFPAWVFNSEYYNSSNYSVGISDPDMDSISAFKQAKIRALINYGIFNNSKYSSLTSVAMVNGQEKIQDATSIETILYTSIIKGAFEIPDSIQIEKKEFTRYNECCVLIKNTSSVNKHDISFNYTIIRRTGFQKENNIFPVFIDELEIISNINDSLQEVYKINRKDKKYDIKSDFLYNNNLKEVQFKNIYRNYFASPDSNNEHNTTYYSSFSSGLWAAYVFELSDQLSFKSVLNKNKANQLITLEQGNINKLNEIGSSNNFILSSRKFDTEPLNIFIEDINLQANYIKIKLKKTDKSTNSSYTQIRLNKQDRKRQKKLVKENWSAYDFTDIKSAFSSLKTFEINNEYISGSTILETKNLGNGILKGMQIARTEIENQLKSKITSQGNLEIENQGNLSSVQTSKIIISEETKRIEPHFIFYRKINNSYYQLNVILFYRI